jgi:hypothetical protein
MGLSTGRQKRNYRGLVYGREGIGKSTWASGAERPFFIDPGGNTERLDVDRWVCSNWNDVKEGVDHAIKSGYKTVVFDDIDKLESMCEDSILKEFGKKNLSGAFQWGEGWAKHEERLTESFDKPFKAGLNVILIGHSVMKTVGNPEGSDYDCHVLSASNRFKKAFDGWYEFILFMKYDMAVNKDDTGKAVGFSKGEARLYCQPRTGYIAKNRYNMPVSISTNFAAFQHFVDIASMSDSDITKELVVAPEGKFDRCLFATALVAQRLKGNA